MDRTTTIELGVQDGQSPEKEADQADVQSFQSFSDATSHGTYDSLEDNISIPSSSDGPDDDISIPDWTETNPSFDWRFVDVHTVKFVTGLNQAVKPPTRTIALEYDTRLCLFLLRPPQTCKSDHGCRMLLNLIQMNRSTMEYRPPGYVWPFGAWGRCISKQRGNVP